MNKIKKVPALLILLVFISTQARSQLAIAKIVGKGADRSKLGYCVFAYYDFPISPSGNKSIRLELMDLALFLPKDEMVDPYWVYISIKLGYKTVFSESKTGFYLEPQAGYCRVVSALEDEDATYGDGIALALEGGYSLETGERGNTFNVGLKYETDRAGKAHTLNSVSLRVSYSFGLFRRRN